MAPPHQAQAMAQLSRELERRPQLRAAVLAGSVRIRAAQTVLPVALGDAEAGWVERARHGRPPWVRVSGTAPDALTWEIGPRHAPTDLRRRLGLDASSAETRAA